MKKVVARIFGGLGNQLFCYAAARRLSLANNAQLALDHVSGFSRDILYQRRYQLDSFSIPCRKATRAERFEPFPRARRYLARTISQRRPFEFRRYVQQEGMQYDPRLLRLQASGTVYLDGYWQSDRYFRDVETTIRSDLEMPAPEDKMNRALAQRIADTQSVAVHFRFFDAPDKVGSHNAPNAYYARAMELMDTLLPNAHYFVFSDKPAAVYDLLPISKERSTLISHNSGDLGACNDLWLMRQCKNFIIANSTFSWWGAWLAANADKKVISPKMKISEGITQWGFDGLLPEDWIEV